MTEALMTSSRNRISSSGFRNSLFAISFFASAAINMAGGIQARHRGVGKGALQTLRDEELAQVVLFLDCVFEQFGQKPLQQTAIFTAKRHDVVGRWRLS